MINRTINLLSLLLLVIGMTTVSTHAQNGVEINPLRDICTSVDSIQRGYFTLTTTAVGDPAPDLTIAGLGSQEVINGRVSAGADWFYRNDNPVILPTNQPGSQIVAWFSNARSRSTFIQITNTATADPSCDQDATMDDPATAGTNEFRSNPTQHVRVDLLDANYNTVIRFCDTYNALDSHIYELSDIRKNSNGERVESVEPGEQGIFVLTAVQECNPDPRSYPVDKHDFFVGTVRITHPDDEAGDFGFNAYARYAEAQPNDACKQATQPAVDCDTTNGNGICLDDLGAKFVADGQPGNTTQLVQTFNRLSPGTVRNVVRGGIALINFSDNYDEGKYSPAPAQASFTPVIYRQDGEILVDSNTGCENLNNVGIENRGLFHPYSLLEEASAGVGAVPETECDDGDDNDGDNATDCADPDCARDAACVETGTECADMMDNDDDEMVDCADSNCEGQPAPGEGMICCGGEAIATPDDGMCPTTTPPSTRSSGGDGCTVVGSATSATATASVLLPMMVFGLAFGLRRIRRRK